MEFIRTSAVDKWRDNFLLLFSISPNIPRIYSRKSSSYKRSVTWAVKALTVGRAMAQAVSRRPLTADPGSVHVGFVVDKVTLGQVFPLVLRFFPVNFIPPVFHYFEK